MSSNCTQVSPQCPVSETLYGYRPNLGGNYFLCILFGVLLVCQLAIYVLLRSRRSYTIFASVGLAGELVGYVGRILLHHNPWYEYAESIQIACLVIAPSFLAAGIYLTLKRIILIYGEQYSRIAANLYPWIFVSCDIATIVVQAAGAAVAAGAGSSGNYKEAKAGDDVILAGIVLQVTTMAVFCAMVADYWQRRKRGRIHSEQKPPQESSGGRIMPAKVGLFCALMALAYITILIRCIYRIHQMAGGWGGPPMRSEAAFMVLDGAMVGLASVCLTLGHPALFLG